MKKLKPWQIVLLVIFYPVGIVYLIVWLCNKNKKEKQGSLTVARDFNTKVVGVTFGNDDGSSRQEYIKRMKTGDDIIFKSMATKEHPEAIGVFNKNGQQLGYLNAELASEIKEKYPINPMSVTVSGVTGGGDKTFGCNLHIIIYNN